ncbi:hypothetical protein OVA07_16540 [Novosphingobium sp. SL115]|uniref:hypothetical protein n=1 Tax=Novosphingobium sp. SL115 TaxID=2995150 RepID=UPI002272C585|nr:hypothetical protein [Novosphingobium sp. SL115]MCY1672608.1 hypothetical protein [Novosphingobium sp. SL115]
MGVPFLTWAQHSFFDQHVIKDDNGCFIAIDEGDYNALPQDLIDRIVHSVPGMMADDFDEANIARAASFMSVVMDPEPPITLKGDAGLKFRASYEAFRNSGNQSWMPLPFSRTRKTGMKMTF